MLPTLNIALRAVRAAGEIIMRSYERQDSFTITQKGAHDFVTEIDQKVEHTLFKQLRQTYPDHAFLGEESGATPTESDYLWILDPLDGTTNFIHGFPQFAISLALRVKGVTELAIVYDPLAREEFTAVRGRGAKLNSRRLRVSQQPGIRDSLIGTGFPFRPEQMSQMETYLKVFREVARQSAGIRRAGAAALDLAYVAAGRLDGFWESGLSIWDIAAGDLLIREAGGLVTDHLGGHDYLDKGNIVAGNPKMVKSILNLIMDSGSSATPQS